MYKLEKLGKNISRDKSLGEVLNSFVKNESCKLDTFGLV